MAQFPHLFSPLALRGRTIRNRILSTGHQTYLARGGLPTDDFIAYHEARAKGGVGLIVTEAARFHASALSDSHEIVVTGDDAIAGYSRLADAVHRHGAAVFGQLSHSGRVSRRMSNGMRGVAYAPSSVPDNRFHTMPRAMPVAMVEELVEACGAAAARFAQAGFDGVELVCSHGLLFAQFLSPDVNRREDRYGGSRDNRMRFLRECLAATRRAVGETMVVGVRMSIEELEQDGIEAQETAAICAALAREGLVDYVNATTGSMAGLGGSIHVVPPMQIDTAYVAPQAGSLRARIGAPVFVAGRINQPQIAERVLAQGLADMCGMTRALISDPDMANKAKAGDLDDIRACIGCNQACIGHYHAGCAISCIQNPPTGRERRLGRLAPAPRRARILVAGGGPAGMKAAAVAAARGPRVILCEAAATLGGQTRLAQLLPDRAEFGGLTTNLEQEMRRAGVEVRLSTPVTADLARAIAPDRVIVATGARPYAPRVEGRDDGHVVDAWTAIRREGNIGARVLVADWRCDWTGVGVAELLAKAGRHVRLAVNGIAAGQNLQMYLRDLWAARLHDLGVEVIPYARLYGVDADAAYMLHIVSQKAIVCEGVDTVVLAAGAEPDTRLEAALQGLGPPLVPVGDCLSPRSAEEAVYEGFVAGAQA